MQRSDLLQRSLPLLQRLARAALGSSGTSTSSWAGHSSSSAAGSIAALQRCCSTSASHQADVTSAGAAAPCFWPQPPPRAANAASGLPAPHIYNLRIVIKGFELRYVQEASRVVRDLLLLHTTPKSTSVLRPTPAPSPDAATTSGHMPMPPINLSLPLGDKPTRKQRTLYTVLRSPHKYKTAREQFERVVHRRLINHCTVSLWELRWILDSLQMYDFTGVQVAVRTTTPTYLQTAPEAPNEPLLAAHRRRFAQDFTLPGTSSSSSAPTTSSSSSSSSSSALTTGTGTGMSASLAALRNAVRSLVREQRLALHPSSSYQEWRAKELRSGGAAARAAAGEAWAGQEPGLLEKAVEALLEQRPELAAEVAGEAGAGGVRDALVEAARQVLLGLDLEQLQRHESFPAAMAHYPLGNKQAPPAAEWMYAMLKFGLYRQQLAHRTTATPEAMRQAFSQYGDFAGVLVALLLQQWHEHTAAGARAQLAVPDARFAGELLARLTKLAQQEEGAVAGREAAAAASHSSSRGPPAAASGVRRGGAAGRRSIDDAAIDEGLTDDDG